MAAEDRRHQMEEKTYAVFTAASVNAMAESARLSPIPHDAAVSLGEDASYRLRQVVMVCLYTIIQYVSVSYIILHQAWDELLKCKF